MENLYQRGILQTWIIGKVPSYQTLDQICNNRKEVFIFIDFNNIIKGLYYPRMLEMILEQIKLNNGVYPSILINEWVKLQDYLETYAINKGIEKFHVIYFSEGGESYYHKNLYKNYKKHRKNALFALPASVTNTYESYDNINDIIRGFLVSSWRWIELLSKEANILSIRLENLDADFIPELLLTRFDIYNDDAAYIIISSDGDMVQTLDIADNIFIFDGDKIISDKNWLSSKSYLDIENKYLEKIDEENIGVPIILNENKIKDITPDKIILYKAIVGDKSDDIPGIKGIGIKSFFNKFIEIIPNDIRADDIKEIEKICNERASDNKVCNKICNDIVTFRKMIRLVSFKQLIIWLTQNKNRYNEIENIINKNMCALKESCKLKSLYKKFDEKSPLVQNQKFEIKKDNI